MNHRDLVSNYIQRPKGARLSNLRAGNNQLSLEGIHLDTIAPESITRWLTTLTSLGGVPLDYLVPDERMLPSESLRFFRVDPNWIYSLIEGAYSVARVTTSDLAHDHVLARNVYDAAAPNLYSHVAPERHSGLQGKSSPFHYSGFLLRSALVSGWPGLRVKAYSEQGKELTPAPGETESGRRITPDILLYLVEGIIHRVTFQEPSEGIHFGLDKTSAGTIAPKKSLRKAVNGPDLGKDAGEVPVSPAAFRPPLQGKDYQVFRIDYLAQKMTEALGSNANRFTPAEFALEMIEGVEGVTVEIAKPEV
jgi:hypothetical protein